MRKILFLLSLAIGFNLTAQNPVCYTTADGTDGSGWSYKDYIIPTGYKIDSVYIDATRNGYPASAFDWELEYCAGTSVYNSSSYTPAWNFGTINTSLYNTWINITSNNFKDVGMVRASLPTNAGAVLNQICLAISPINSAMLCYTTTDGTDGSGWSYKDFVIPTGYKVDSVYMDATRTSYPTSAFDWELEYCAGTSIYNSGSYTAAWNFSTTNTSLYSTWINITANNFTDIGMVRASLPTNAGAVWNNLCFATSLQGTTGVKNISTENQISIYPNPATEIIYLQNVNKPVSIEILNVTGQLIKSIRNPTNLIDISDFPKGFYFIKIIGTSNQLEKTLKFIKE